MLLSSSLVSVAVIEITAFGTFVLGFRPHSFGKFRNNFLEPFASYFKTVTGISLSLGIGKDFIRGNQGTAFERPAEENRFGMEVNVVFGVIHFS